MTFVEMIRGLLGGVSPLPEEARAELLSTLDTLGDSLRSQLRDEIRALTVDEDEHSRLLGVTHGLEFGAQIFHGEDSAGVLGFLTGLIMVAAQAVFHDAGARRALMGAMGESNRLGGEQLSEKFGYSGATGETLMSLSQLVSSGAFLSLMLTGNARPPVMTELGLESMTRLTEEDIRNARPASDMTPELREAALAALSSGRVVVADAAQESMDEKGLSIEEVTEMLRKAMTN